MRPSSYIQIRDTGSHRGLRMRIGPLEWDALDRELRQEPFPRPITHRAMANIIDATGGELTSVLVDDYDSANDFYYAKLLIARDDKVTEVDVRPSDAFVLAVICAVPIVVTHNLLDGQNIGDLRRGWGFGLNS